MKSLKKLLPLFNVANKDENRFHLKIGKNSKSLDRPTGENAGLGEIII